MAKLSMRERYSLLTRDLDWTPTYVDPKEVYPYTRYEGIKIHDWDKWEDPFRLTMDAYWKYQAEKERKLRAVIPGYQAELDTAETYIRNMGNSRGEDPDELTQRYAKLFNEAAVKAGISDSPPPYCQ